MLSVRESMACLVTIKSPIFASPRTMSRNGVNPQPNVRPLIIPAPIKNIVAIICSLAENLSLLSSRILSGVGLAIAASCPIAVAVALGV